MKNIIRNRSIAFFEISIVLFIWIIIFASPLFLQFDNEIIEWEKVFGIWKKFLPYLGLTIVNHVVLFPLLFIRTKKGWYIVSAIFILIAFSFLQNVVDSSNTRVNLDDNNIVTGIHRPPTHANVPGLRPGGRIEDMPRDEESPFSLPPIMNYAILALLILGFDTGLRSAFRWTKMAQENQFLEKEKVKSELAFLRNQINPHFLMNTLNNIHGLIEFDTEAAKDTVIRLSKLMRYLLYDTERELIPIKEELSFIRSYVELMVMRISKRVKVSLDIDAKNEEKTLPPLLFTNLIENAFKYGISHRKDTFIDIKLVTNESQLVFELTNTIVQQEKKNSTFYSGIGQENTRKRLDILYGDSYTFDISSDDDIYSVKLILPI